MDSEKLEERVAEELKTFEAELRRSLTLAKDPTNVKWGLFSTGDPEIEAMVLKLIVKNMLKTIEGIYVFRVDEEENVEKILRLAVEHYKKKIEGKEAVISAVEDSDYKLTLGII